MIRTKTLRVLVSPLRRRLSARALSRRAFRTRSRWLTGVLVARREKLLALYERLLTRSVRMESRLQAVTERLAAVDRAVRVLWERR